MVGSLNVGQMVRLSSGVLRVEASSGTLDRGLFRARLRLFEPSRGLLEEVR
jgi:hypothetical protein